MSNLKEQLLKLASDQPSTWKEDAKYRIGNRAWLNKSALIALKVLDALSEQQLTQKDLAERMKISPQQISKIVKGHENLTLETIAKLEAALTIKILPGVGDKHKTLRNKKGSSM